MHIIGEYSGLYSIHMHSAPAASGLCNTVRTDPLLRIYIFCLFSFSSCPDTRTKRGGGGIAPPPAVPAQSSCESVGGGGGHDFVFSFHISSPHSYPLHLRAIYSQLIRPTKVHDVRHTTAARDIYIGCRMSVQRV